MNYREDGAPIGGSSDSLDRPGEPPKSEAEPSARTRAKRGGRAKRIVRAFVAVVIVYAAAWGASYARLRGLDAENGVLRVDASTAYGDAVTLQEQAQACPAAAASLGADGGADALGSRAVGYSSFLSPALWTMIAQNHRIEGMISQNLATETRAATYSAHLLETMHANGCEIYVEGTIAPLLDDNEG